MYVLPQPTTNLLKYWTNFYECCYEDCVTLPKAHFICGLLSFDTVGIDMFRRCTSFIYNVQIVLRTQYLRYKSKVRRNRILRE
jgi:hypothetical protein